MDIHLGIIRSGDDTVGLGQHTALGHGEAEIAVIIVADDQIDLTAVGDGGAACGSEAERKSLLCVCVVRRFGILGQIPVSALNIHTDFRCQPFQEDFLFRQNLDGRDIVGGGCNGIENFVGFTHAQRCQNAVLEQSQKVAHPQVQLAVMANHTVDVVLQLPGLPHGAKAGGSDVIGSIIRAVESGLECDLSVFHHQIHRQTALRQVERVGDAVAGGRGFGLGGNLYGLDGNGLFLCNGPVDGQGGAAAGVEAARTEHQNAGCQVLICHVALGNEGRRALPTLVDGAARKLVAVCIGKNLLTGGAAEFFVGEAQLLISIKGIVLCLTVVEAAIAVAVVLDLAVHGEDMVLGVRQIVEIPVLGFGVVEQGLAEIHHIVIVIQPDTLQVELGLEDAAGDHKRLGIDQSREVRNNDFLPSIGQFRVGIGLCPIFIGGNRFQIVLAVALDHDDPVGNVVNFTFSNRAILSCIGFRHRNNLVFRIAVPENDLAGFILVVLIALLDLFIDLLLRDQTDLSILNLRQDTVNAVQLVAVGTGNLGTLVEDHFHFLIGNLDLQGLAVFGNGILVVIPFIHRLEGKLFFRLEILAGVEFAVLRVFENGNGFAVDRNLILLAGGVVLHGQGRVGGQKLGVVQQHFVAVHGDAAVLIPGCQHILGKEVDADKFLHFPVGPGVLCQLEAVAVVDRNLLQVFPVFVIGLYGGYHLRFCLGAEDPCPELCQEGLLSVSQIVGLRVCGVAHARNLHQGDHIAAAYQLQNGFAIPIFQSRAVTGSGEVIEGKGHVGVLLCHVDEMRGLLGFLVLIGAFLCQVRAVIVGFAGEIPEIIPVVGIVLDLRARTQGEQLHGIGSGIVGQDVVGFPLGVVQLSEGGLQTGKVVIAPGTGRIQLYGFNIPFHHVFHIFAVDASGQDIPVGVLGAAQTYLDVGEQHALGIDKIRLGIHNGEQHIEGCVGIHIELAGGQIDVNTVVQTDAGNLVLIIALESVVPHRHGGIAFFNPADVVERVHPEHRSVGQQISVQARGGIVAVQVAVQQFDTVDGTVLCQGYGLGLIAQGPGHRHGNHHGIGFHSDVPHAAQCQLHAAGLGPDLFHQNGCRAVAASHVFDGHHGGNHIQEDVSLGGGADNGGSRVIGGHPHVERNFLCSDAGGMDDVQLVCPDGGGFILGIKDGHLFLRVQLAAGFAGPLNGELSVVQRQELADFHIALAAGGDGESGRAIAGCLVIHAVGLVVHNHTGVNVAAVGSVEFRHNQLQIRTVGDGRAGNAALVVNMDRSQALIRHIQERLAGQVVHQVLQGNLIRAQRVIAASADTRLTDDHAASGIAAVVGNIHIHTACRVTQVEAGAACDRGSVGISAEAGIVYAVVVDEATVSQVAFDSGLVKVVAGDGNLSASVDKAAADDGPGLGVHFAHGVGLALADGVQLHRGVVADIGGSVLRLDGGIDVCPVVGGNIRVVDFGVGLQPDGLVADGVHIGAQGGALGVGLTVDVQAADVGNDVDHGTLNHSSLAAGLDGHIGRKGDVVADVCSGSRTQTGGIGTANAVDAVFRAVGSDGNRTKPVPDLSGAHSHLRGGINRHINEDFGGGNHAVGIDFRVGGDDVAPACLGENVQLAKVGLDHGAVQNGNGGAARQRILGADLGFRVEAFPILGGSGRHVGIGDGAGREVGIGIHGALQLNGIHHIHLVFALCVIQIDDAACGNVGAGYDALSSGIVLRGDADAAQLGNQLGISACVCLGVVIAGGGQGLLLHIREDGCLGAGLDVGCGGALVEGADNNILPGPDGAAGDAGLGALASTGAGADAGVGIGLGELHAGQTASGFGEGIGNGAGHTLNTEAHRLQIHAGQIGMDGVVGIGVAAHIVEGDSRDLIRHTAVGIRAGDGAGKDLDLTGLHGVGAGAFEIGIVHTNRSGFCFDGVRTDQRDLFPVFFLGIVIVIGRLPAGGVGGAVIDLSIVGAAVNQGFHRHIACRKAAAVFDIRVLLHLQIGVYIRNRNAHNAQAELGADASGIGQALAGDLHRHIIADDHAAAGGQRGPAGNRRGIGIDRCLSQVDRTVCQRHTHALAGGGGAGIGDGSIPGQNLQRCRADVLSSIVHISLEAAAGGCLADEYAEGRQTRRVIASAVVGLGNGIAKRLDGEHSFRCDRRILNQGFYLRSGIGNGRVGIDGENGNGEAAAALAAALAAAGNDGAGSDLLVAFIEAGMDADIISLYIGILDISILPIQQPCFHEIHSQFCHVQLVLGTVEAGFRLSLTGEGNLYVSLLRGLVGFRFAAGNARLGCNPGIGQGHVGSRAHKADADTRVGLGAHGLCPGRVGVADFHRLALDLLAGGIAHIGAEVAAGIGVNLGQEQGYQAQLTVLRHVAPGKGTAFRAERHSSGNIQIGIADIAMVLAAEQRIGGIGRGTDFRNADTGHIFSQSVAAADHCQSPVKLAVIVEDAVLVQLGFHGEAVGPQGNVLNQGLLGNLHVCRCRVGCEGYAGNADHRRIHPCLRHGGTGGGNLHSSRHVDHAAGGLAAQNAGSGLCQVSGRGHIDLMFTQAGVDTAHRRGDDRFGIADIGIGNVQPGRVDVGLHITETAHGLDQRFKGSLRVGKAGVEPFGGQTKADGSDIRRRGGLGVVGHLDVHGGELLGSHQRSAGGVGNGVRRAGGCRQRACACGKHQCLGHGGKGTAELLVILGDGQFEAAEVKVAAAGLLGGFDGHIAVEVFAASANVHHALAVHFGFLYVLQVCHRHRDLRTQNTRCRTGKHRIGSAKADGIDLQAVGCEAAAGARNQGSVVAGIPGNANIQVGSRTAGRAGNAEDQRLIVVGLFFCTRMDEDLVNLHHGIAQVQLGRIVGFREGCGHDGANANRSCRQAGCPDGGIAVNGGGNGQAVGGHALPGHGGLVPGGIEGQCHQRISGNAAGRRCRTDSLGDGIGIGGNPNILRGELAAFRGQSSIGRIADPAVCHKIVDDQNNIGIHRDQAAGQGDVVGPGFRGNVVVYFHIAVLRGDGHVSSDVGFRGAAVDGHDKGRVAAAHTGCRGGRRADGSGNARGINPDVARDIPDGAAAINGRLGLAAEIGSGSGAIDTCHTAAEGAVDGHHLAEVHVAVNGYRITGHICFLSGRRCLYNGACQHRVGLAEHQQHGNARVHAHHTAGNHQGHQADGRLAGFVLRFSVVSLFCVFVHFEGIVADVHTVFGFAVLLTVIGFTGGSGLIGHTRAAVLHRLQLGHGSGARGGFHQNGAASAEGGSLADFRVHIGVENGHGDTDTHTAHTGSRNAGGNVGIEYITGGNADVARRRDGAAGANDGGYGILIGLAAERGGRPGILDRIPGIVDVLVFFHRILLLVIDRGIRARTLAEIIVIAALGTLAVALQQGGHFSVIPLFVLQGIGSGGLAGIVFIRLEAFRHLCFGIHAVGVNTVMGILGHFVAHQNYGNGQRHTGSGTADDVGGHAQNVPVGKSRHLHVSADDGIIGADAGFHSGVGNTDQRNHTESRAAGADGQTCHNRVDIEGIAAIDGHITGGVNFHIITGVGLGGELGDDHVEGAVYGHGAAAGNTRCVGGDHFPGGGPDDHVTGDLLISTSNDSVGILRTGKDMGQGLVLKIGYHGNRRCGYGAGDSGACGNIVELCVGIRVYRHALCLGNGADCRLNGAAEYQNIDVSGNTRAAAGAKADGQQEHIIIAVGGDGNGFLRADGLGIQNGTDGLVVNQRHNRSAGTGRTAHSQGARRVCQVAVVFGIHGNLAAGGHGNVAFLTALGFLILLGQLFVSAHQSFHVVFHHQGIDYAGNGHASARAAADGEGHNGVVGSGGNGNAPSAGHPVGHPVRQVGSILAVGGEHRVVYGCRNRVAVHSRVNGSADGRAAAGGQSARRHIGLSGQVGNDADAVAGGKGRGSFASASAADNGFNGAGADNHGNAAGNGHAAGAAGCQNYVDKEVISVGFHQDGALLRGEAGISGHLRAHIAVEDAHGHGARSRRVAAGRGGEDRGQGPGVALGQDDHILFGFQGAAHDGSFGAGVADNHRKGGGAGNIAGGGSRRGGEGHQALVGHRADGHTAVCACKLGAGPGPGLGIGAGDDYGNGSAARNRAADTGSDCQRNDDQSGVIQGQNLHGFCRGNFAGNRGLDVILHINHVHGAANRIAAGTGGHTGCNGNAEIVRIVFGPLREAAAHGQLARGFRSGNVGKRFVAVADGAHGQTHAQLGGAHVQGTRNQSGGGFVPCQNLRAAGDADLSVLLQLAHIGLHLVAVEQHGKGARHGELAVCRRGHNGTGHSLRVVVHGGQEVQKIDGIDELVGAHVDGDFIPAAVLLQVEDALLHRRFLFGGQSGGIRDQHGFVQRQIIVRHGHLMLDGVDLQIAAALQGLGAVLNQGQNLVFRVNQGEGGSHTDGGACADADTAGTDCQLCLVGSRDLQIAPGIQNAAFHGRGSGLSLGSEHREGTADGGVAAFAGDTACQRLGAQGSPVDSIHVGGMDGNDHQIAGLLRIPAFGQTGDDGAGIFGNGLVLVDGNGHACRDGQVGAGQSHRSTVGTGPEIGVVLRVELHVQGGQTAADQRLGLMLCDIDAHGRGHLDALILGSGHIGPAAGDIAVLLIGAAGDAGLGQTAGVLDGRGGAGLGPGVVGQSVIPVGNVFRRGFGGTQPIQIPLDIGAHSRSGGKGIVGIVGPGQNPGLSGGRNGSLKLCAHIGIGVVHRCAGAHCCRGADGEGTGGGQGMALLLSGQIHGNQILGLGACLLQSRLLFFFRIFSGQRGQIFFLIKAADVQIALIDGHTGAFRDIGVYLIVDLPHGNRRVQGNVHGIFGRRTVFGSVRQRIRACRGRGSEIILEQGHHADGAGFNGAVFSDEGSGPGILVLVYRIDRKAGTNADAGAGGRGIRGRGGIRNHGGGRCGSPINHDDLHGDLGILFNAILIDFGHQEPVALLPGGSSGSGADSGSPRGGGSGGGSRGLHGFDLYLLGDTAGGRIGQQNVIHIIGGGSTAPGAGLRDRIDLNRDLCTDFDRLIVPGVDCSLCGLTVGAGGVNRLFHGEGSAFDLVGGKGGGRGGARAAGGSGTSGGSGALVCNLAHNHQLGLQNLGEGYGNVHRCSGIGLPRGRRRKVLVHREPELAVGKVHRYGSGGGGSCAGGSGGGDGIGYLFNLIARVGGNYQGIGRLVAVSGNGYIVHQTVVGFPNGQHTAVIGLCGSQGTGTCSVGLGVVLGGGSRVILRIDRGAGDGVLILLVLGPDDKALFRGNWVGFAGPGRGRVFYISQSLGVDDGKGQTSGHTNIGCAGAGHRMGPEGVGGIFPCGNNLGVRPFGQGGQHAVGGRLTGGRQGVDDGRGDILSEARGEEGLHLGNVDKIPKELACEGFQGGAAHEAQLPQFVLLVLGQTVNESLDFTHRSGGRCGCLAGGAGGRAVVGRRHTGNIHGTGQFVDRSVQRGFCQGGESVQNIGQQNVFHNAHGRVADFLSEAVREVLEFGLDVVGQQLLQAHLGEQGLGELANHGTHKIRGKVAETFQDFPGSTVQLGDSVFHAFPDGLLDQEVQDIDALVGLGLLDCFLGQGLGIGAVVVHFRDQQNFIGGNGGQADYGSVERVYKVDGHADAHAHRGIDGAGNGIYRGIRIVVGGHLQGAVQLNGNAVVDDGFIQVFLDV